MICRDESHCDYCTGYKAERHDWCDKMLEFSQNFKMFEEDIYPMNAKDCGYEKWWSDTAVIVQY